MSRGLLKGVKFEKTLDRVSEPAGGLGRDIKAEDNHSRGSTRQNLSNECLINAGGYHFYSILRMRWDTASDCEAVFLSYLLSSMSVL